MKALPLLLALLMSGSILSAAGLSQTETLTWENARAQAAKNSLEIKSAEAQLSSAIQTESAAWSGFYPQITGQISNTSTNSSTSSTTGLSAGVTATEAVFSGFEDQAKVEQAKISLQNAEINLRVAKAKVSADLKGAFASLIYAQNQKSLVDKIKALRESNLRQVELRFQSGRENKGSVLLSSAYLEQAKYDLLQAEQGLENAKIQLAKVLNIEAESAQSLRIEGSAPAVQLQTFDPQQLALNTPDYLLAINQERSAQATLKSSKSGYWPSLSLSASSTNYGSSWFPSTNQWSLGATLSYSFFSGGKTYYTTEAAKQTLQASIYSQESSLRLSYLKIKQAAATLREAQQKVVVDSAFQEASNLREKIAHEKYNNGIISFDDWDLIENDSISRQKSYLQSLRDLIAAEAAWEQALGKGSIQ